jgi:hypothetical protein
MCTFKRCAQHKRLFLMKNTIYLTFIFFTVTLVSTPLTNINAQNKSYSTTFNDNGKTIDSLKNAYNCEKIEYKNSADKKNVDSCLTVYLINSTNVFLENDFNKNAHHLKNVEVAIMHVLTKPHDYRTINVFFVNKFNLNGSEKTIHTAGLEMSTKGL